MEGIQSWIRGMKQYQTPPPGQELDLSRLNPVQRYFHKGALDWSDYGRLLVIVAIYWFLRPYIQKVAKRWSDESQGDDEREAYKQRREDAQVGANSIRSGKEPPKGKTLGDILDHGIEGHTNSASATATATQNEEAGMKNRKQQKSKKGVSFVAEKSAEDKTLDWEDESEFNPSLNAASTEETQPERNDIKEWMEKWTA